MWYTFIHLYNRCYCPDQFEILGCSYQYGDCGEHIDGKGWGVSVNNKDIYKRIFIRHKDNYTI